MLITVVTIFPEMFPGSLSYGLLGKALKNKLFDLKTVNIRDFANDKHRKVDDSPYGGGAGMLMKPDIIHESMKYALSLYKKDPIILYMTPRGKVFNNKIAKEIMNKNNNNNDNEGIIILCGRYEGIDQRVIDFWKNNHKMLEISIGDYILFGGEIAAMVVIESCIRFLDGSMNNSLSTEDESFSVDLLEYPQYTKPVTWNGENVPSVLLSGNHKEIELWRDEKSKQITRDIRPDLWDKYLNNK